MNYKNIIYEKKSSIAKIVINRPEVLNAVDSQTIVELKDALSQVGKDPQIRAIILTGSGEKSFIVGADKKEIHKRSENVEEAENFETCCRETFDFIENLGKPTICAINGYAFGLGLQLALACTFRIVSSNAILGLPEINFGFFPSMGATQRLTRLIGEAKATEMILTGESIDGEEAYRIGLANKKVSPNEMCDYVENLAEKLAEKSPTVMKLAMEAIKYEKGTSMEDGLAYEAKLSEICFKSKETKE
jgi:enoyl-CoA hydratase